jgi:hypothetical protein
MPTIHAPAFPPQPGSPGGTPIIWLESDEFMLWRRRVTAEHAAANLTRARRDALVALVGLIGPDGLFPSDETVAARAHCCARTVRRARQDARELGLLDWQHTRKLGADGRWRQGANSYRLKVPDGPVCPGGQKVRLQTDSKKKKALQDSTPAHRVQIAQMMREAEGIPNLAQLAAEAEARFAARWAADRAGRLAGRVAA